MRNKLPLLLLSTLAACSTSAPLTPDATVQSAELFMSRATLNDTHFEQFKVDNNRMYYECGVIRRGRFAAEEQKVAEVPAEKTEALTQVVADLMKAINESKASFEAPGVNKDLVDPGQLYLTFVTPGQEKEIKTSFDSVMTGRTIPEQKLHKVASVIRNFVGAPLCNSLNFFGLK